VKNLLRQILAKGEIALGMKCASSPALVEIMGYAGLDFVAIDMEHGPLGFEIVEQMIRAAEVSQITPLVRVPRNDPSDIQHALDSGAQGVIVPHVMKRADAERVVEACRYPPQGRRGTCPRVRAGHYGLLNAKDYYAEANREVQAIILVEDPEALDRIDDILSTPGLDIVYIGLADLSQSMGFPGQGLNAPEIRNALNAVCEASVLHQISVMSVAYPNPGPTTIRMLVEMGIQIINLTADVMVFAFACQQFVRMKGHIRSELQPTFKGGRSDGI